MSNPNPKPAQNYNFFIGLRYSPVGAFLAPLAGRVVWVGVGRDNALVPSCGVKGMCGGVGYGWPIWADFKVWIHEVTAKNTRKLKYPWGVLAVFEKLEHIVLNIQCISHYCMVCTTALSSKLGQLGHILPYNIDTYHIGLEVF